MNKMIAFTCSVSTWPQGYELVEHSGQRHQHSCFHCPALSLQGQAQRAPTSTPHTVI